MLLPKKVGPFTLMRRLGADGATESYTAILDDPAGKQVVARRIEPWLRDDPKLGRELEQRVRDLQQVRHPALISTLDYFVVDGEHYIISDWVDGVSLRQLLFWCIQHRESLPHNIYLDIAAKVCNGLEALHSRPGAESGAEHVLHLGLSPECVILRPDGGVVVGVYGLVRSPTVSSGGSAAGVNRIEYLSPEQTHPDQPLTPAADIFALGATLYEMLTLDPLFKAGSRLQTMHRIRRAEVTTQLLEVKETLPGLDKVLYRALSLNPRHRYQRAFVLREDLRGLMAGYSFAEIDVAMRDFIRPLVQAKLVGDTDEVMPHLPPVGPQESTDALLEGSMHDIDLPPGFFSETESSFPGDDTRAAFRAADVLDGLPELQEISERSFVENDTGALLRQANTESEIDIDLDVFRQAANSGTPAPKPRHEEPAGESLSAAPVTPGGLDPTSVPEPSIAARPTSAPPLPAPPTSDATGLLQRVPTPRELEEAGPEGTEELPEPEPEPTAENDPEPVAPVDLGRTPRPGPERAPAAERLAPESGVAVPHDRAPVDEATDDFSDLDWKPGAGPSPAVLAAGVGLFMFVGVICLGASAMGLLSGLTGAPADDGRVAVAAMDAAPLVAPTLSDPDEADARPEPEPRAETSRPPPSPRVAPESRPEPRPPAPASPRPAPRVAAPDPTPDPAPIPVTPREPATHYLAPEPEVAAVPERFEDDAVALAELAVDEPEPLPVEGPTDLSDLSALAREGRLGGADRAWLEGVGVDDPDYTRARVLLYEDAKQRSDLAGQRRHIQALMVLPENNYRPEYLVEEAWIALQHRDYASALARAELAERHWARLPSDLVFSRRAAIFEVEAAAHTGLFYASDGEDLEALDRAIRVWEKYRQHVQTRQRSDLDRHAAGQIAKLTDMQERLK